MLKKDGIRVISVKEPIPDDDKFAVIYESMLEAMAEYYSLNLAEEVKKTMVKKAQRGEYQTAAPFGYKNDNKTLAVVPCEAEIIKYIFDLFVCRRQPLNAIASSLNSMGITTHRGGMFESRTIDYILNNPVYCGYARWTPDGRIRRNFSNPSTLIVKGSFEPIISEETFKAAQDLIKISKSTRKRSRPISEVKHYLSGVIKCSACGKSLVIVRNFKKGGFFMQCGGYNHGICSVSHSISSSVLIPAVIKAFSSLPDSKVRLSLKVRHTGNSERTRQTAVFTEKAEKRLRRAKEAFLAGIDSIEEYKAVKEKIENEIAEIKKADVSADSRESSKYIENFIKKSRRIAELLQDTNIEMADKKEAVRCIVERMVFNRPEGRLDIYIKG